MIEQETDFTLADRMDRLDDIGQNLAAIIAITRRDWMPQSHASPSLDGEVVNHTRLEHALFTLALDSKLGCT